MKKLIFVLSALFASGSVFGEDKALSPEAKIVFEKVVNSSMVKERIAEIKMLNQYCPSGLEEESINNVRIIQFDEVPENELVQAELAGCQVGKDCLIFFVNFACKKSSSPRFGGYRFVVSTNLVTELTSVGPIETIVW